MKLSDAIQTGTPRQDVAVTSTGIKPCQYLDFTHCALGAAWLGVGGSAADLTNGVEILQELSLNSGVDLFTTFVPHPETEHPMLLAGIVVSLNDMYGWERDEIVSWLRLMGY